MSAAGSVRGAASYAAAVALGGDHLGVPDGAVDRRGGEAIADAYDEHGQLAAFPWQLGIALSGVCRDEHSRTVSWSGGSRRRLRMPLATV